MTTYAQFLRESAVTKEELDVFLDPQQPSLFQFDPELGYILGNYMPRDGIHGSLTITTVQKNGARNAIVYSDRPCRINTYGNSFTHCHQVSDHETWQEVLAAHFGEPIRNFGVGGYGVYQAYRRMIRTEITGDDAEYILFYIWGDDHLRSLLRCRHALTHPWWAGKGGRLFHGNFWAHLEIDLDDGRFVEKENPLSTPQLLYQMADPDFMFATLRDDLMLQISAFSYGLIDGMDSAGRESARRLAEILQCEPVDFGDPARVKAQINHLRDRFSFKATKYIVDRAVEFASSHGKQILFVLFDPQVTQELITTGRRYDQEIVDFLEARRLRYFDMNLAHVADFACFRIPLEEYMKRYFIGHYNPAGNHFFAFAIKDTLVDWLDPKQVTYREDESQALIDFRGYLPGE